jgi:MFS family permease
LLLLNVHDIGTLLAGRLLVGVGTGLASSSLTSYIVDAAPSRPEWWPPSPPARDAGSLFAIALLGGVLQQGGPQLFSGFHMAMAVAAGTCVLATLVVFIIEPGPTSTSFRDD